MRSHVLQAAIVVVLSQFFGSSYGYALGTAFQVVSYDAGSTPTAGFTSPAAALGAPERFTGESTPFPGTVSPFNPAFLSSEVISVGEGGHLTLRLSHLVLPQASEPEIGVFTNTGFIDVDFPNGLAGSDPVATFGVDDAHVAVSADGVSWVSLGNVTFDLPTNGYTDLTDPFSGVPGSVESSFDQPFIGSLSDFADLNYYDNSDTDMLDVLGGSGGGTWLDISGTGLSEVSWLRLSVADDGDSQTSLNFELDAVTIAASALGSAVPEPSTWVLLVVASATCCRRRSHSGR